MMGARADVTAHEQLSAPPSSAAADRQAQAAKRPPFWLSAAGMDVIHDAYACSGSAIFWNVNPRRSPEVIVQVLGYSIHYLQNITVGS